MDRLPEIQGWPTSHSELIATYMMVGPIALWLEGSWLTRAGRYGRQQVSMMGDGALNPVTLLMGHVASGGADGERDTGRECEDTQGEEQ